VPRVSIDDATEREVSMKINASPLHSENLEADLFSQISTEDSFKSLTSKNIFCRPI